MVLLKYIFCNLGRKKKQTFFSLLCILVSSLVVLADFALLNGIGSGLKEGINEVLSGQITVYDSADKGMNILESQLKDQVPFRWDKDDEEKFIQEFPEIRVNRRIRIGSLISYGEETSYVHFHALEKNHMNRVGRMLTFQAGNMPERAGEIIISEKLADDLKCGIGDTVLLMANNMYDYMSDALGVVSGIFQEKGLAIFLNYSGFISYADGKAMAQAADEECLELVLNPSGGRDFSNEEIKVIRDYFNREYAQLQLVSWEKTVPLLYSVVKVWSGGGVITQISFLFFSLIILITLTSLIVRSRRKEIGTLRAIGFSWDRVNLLVCMEYLILCVFSVLISFVALEILLNTLGVNGISIHGLEMQSALMTDRLFPFLMLKDLLYVGFLFLLATLLSAWISMRRLRHYQVYSLINN